MSKIKRKAFCSVLAFTVFVHFLSAQEFSATIHLRNDQGMMDSVVIGYDPFAEDGMDPDLGEIDLSGTPMNDFEMRAGQIFVEQLNEQLFSVPFSFELLSQYSGKREFIPKNCLSFIAVGNQAGFLPTINLFIKTNFFPVYIKWNKSEFENDCVRKSFITDWPVNTWWDIPCCNSLLFGEILLSARDSITLYQHSGIDLIDESGDTIIMLTILLEDALGTAIPDLDVRDLPVLHPNPSNGAFTIPDEWRLLRVVNQVGEVVDFVQNGLQVQLDVTGLSFLFMEKDGVVQIVKQINIDR